MNALSFGRNQRPAQIRVLGVRGERFELSLIFAAVRNDESKPTMKHAISFLKRFGCVEGMISKWLNNI
jgi:hypothetical protein